MQNSKCNLWMPCIQFLNTRKQAPPEMLSQCLMPPLPRSWHWWWLLVPWLAFGWCGWEHTRPEEKRDSVCKSHRFIHLITSEEFSSNLTNIQYLSRLLPLPLSGSRGHQAAHHYAHLSPALRASALHWTHLDSFTLLIAPSISVCSSVCSPDQH